ncbi:hypothetical protein C9I57_05315 [Trinickia symbiotica]|uniref:Uncharacterized protein n=1 Tax=Trinickia symbiotica TaxID=863227 RepID=A0A2T3XZT6_9BURK|nr:hypothetical protein C9I57_05315 [Trinickia symbiotica]
MSAAGAAVTKDRLNALPCANRRVPSAVLTSALMRPFAEPPEEAVGVEQLIVPLADEVDVELLVELVLVDVEPDVEVVPEVDVVPEVEVVPEVDVVPDVDVVPEVVPVVDVDAWIQQYFVEP